jgi:uncharacterized protein YkwD
MKYLCFTLPRLLGFTFLFFSLSAGTAAQRIQPDGEILRRMTDYVADLEIKAAADAARKRSSRERTSFGEAPVYKKASYRSGSVVARDKVNSSTPASVFALERKAFDIINRQRSGKGLAPLRWNDELARVARLHSENMARHRFFSHTGRDGLSVNHRARQLGVRGFRAIGENIAFNQGFSKPVEMACQHWMTSPGHRGNILDRGWTESGIGVAAAPDGGYFFTQVFITR